MIHRGTENQGNRDQEALFPCCSAPLFIQETSDGYFFARLVTVTSTL